MDADPPTSELEIEIRPDEYELLVGGRRVGLTAREFQTFHALARRPDRVVKRADIYQQVWGGPIAQRDRSVDVCVRKVRRKLAKIAPQVAFIHTHFGIGYRFSPEPVLVTPATEPATEHLPDASPPA